MLPNDQAQSVALSLRRGEYSLLLGAGISLDSRNALGDFLPSGDSFKKDLCALKGVSATTTLQRVYSSLTEPEIKDHVTDRFNGCKAGRSAYALRSFSWKRVFTLNIDDAIEDAYRQEPPQSPNSINFCDDFVERDNPMDLQIIHLHGFVRKPKDGYVFSTQEYVRQMRTNNAWMINLTHFLPNEPFIISGTRFDEVDIEYYLSFRSSMNSRKDRAPSIFVTPNPDALTRNDCERYDLLLFRGTIIDFFDYIQSIPVPDFHNNVEETSFSLPVTITGRDRLALESDFETVEINSESVLSLPLFLYGAEPSWTDLSNDLDVGRRLTRDIDVALQGMLHDPETHHRLLLYLDQTGGGKSTLLRRLAYNSARRGITTLLIRPSARLDVRRTTALLDQFEQSILIFADNLAEHATSLSQIYNNCEKNDIYFVGAERTYRYPYLSDTLRGLPCVEFRGRDLSLNELRGLVSLYTRFGLVGDPDVLRSGRDYGHRLAGDSIAIACCRILNDFRPFDRIVNSLWSDTDQQAARRFLLAALSRRCFSSGVRVDLLRALAGPPGWRTQFGADHPLPLVVVREFDREFVRPLNDIVAEQVLQFAANHQPDVMLDCFTFLANGLASRVNRTAIRRRSADARLAGSLFDYDRTVRPLLGVKAETFYSRMARSWQWNSRYWEQVSLLHLDRFIQNPGSHEGAKSFETALQHARHARSVEIHPHTLTTLGKVLFSFADVKNQINYAYFEEGAKSLYDAIQMEQRWARINIQPFVIYLQGVRRHIERGGQLHRDQFRFVRRVVELARVHFRRDQRIMQDCVDLERAIATL